MQKIYLDFETYYDVQLSLTKMSTVQYINHPDFKSFVIEEDFLDYPNRKPFDVLYHASTLLLLGENERLRRFEIEEDEASLVMYSFRSSSLLHKPNS